MELVNALVILRYILDDDPVLSNKASTIIENRYITIPFEVVTEIVYVLEKLYHVSRDDIYDSLVDILNYPNISSYDDDVLFKALDLFRVSPIDFVDCLLCAYHKIRKYHIYTFD